MITRVRAYGLGTEYMWVGFLLRSRRTSGWDTSTLSWEGGRRKERKGNGNGNLGFLGGVGALDGGGCILRSRELGIFTFSTQMIQWVFPRHMILGHS